MTFTAWLEENREELIELHRNDYEEALFKAFLAGMDHVGSSLKTPLTAFPNNSITKE